jgi:hypothetical protein
MIDELRNPSEGYRLALEGSYYVDTGEPPGVDIPTHDFSEQEEKELAARICQDGPAVVKAWRAISEADARKLGREGMDEARRLWNKATMDSSPNGDADPTAEAPAGADAGRLRRLLGSVRRQPRPER